MPAEPPPPASTQGRCVQAEAWDDLGSYLAAKARALEAGGADFLAIGSNTGHVVASAIEASTTLPLLHIADVVAGAAGRLGAQRLGLLGTRPVMEGRYYHDRLGSHGFEVIAPEVADREFVHRLIFEELTRGQSTQASRTAFTDIIGKLDAAGAEAVVLGCTEFGLLVKQSDVPETPLLDTTGLYIEAIVKEALAA
ncbi:amino acid racemase (plasmid) [Streptomyces sp. NBC_00841]|uniref:aspartate/glutamate racemase family protein n=1 Tax=unclassified Streptomyces TaxID=2593676 RepID=UPI0022590159|nr:MULTISPECIES: amino acid racemase [unclassified Streptomyces]MCX4538063.1 amino acid racemase [Streptomyces sp. NBC_01669]WSA05893.1 amino acid racemase [Streptomyces sp. NBC_00841]